MNPLHINIVRSLSESILDTDMGDDRVLIDNIEKLTGHEVKAMDDKTGLLDFGDKVIVITDSLLEDIMGIWPGLQIICARVIRIYNYSGKYKLRELRCKSFDNGDNTEIFRDINIQVENVAQIYKMETLDLTSCKMTFGKQGMMMIYNASDLKIGPRIDMHAIYFAGSAYIRKKLGKIRCGDTDMNKILDTISKSWPTYTDIDTSSYEHLKSFEGYNPVKLLGLDKIKNLDIILINYVGHRCAVFYRRTCPYKLVMDPIKMKDDWWFTFCFRN